jgi:uncharacterized membrane protein YbhN (UPF0104 family)
MKNYYPKLIKYGGIAISLLAIFFVIKTINGNTLKETIASIKVAWLIPVVIINFAVILSKAFRWQILVKPLSHISLGRITSILTVGFMANNILPARLGDAVRVHMLHRRTDLGHATTAGGLIADKILEGIAFLFLTLFLFFFISVPDWMRYGLLAMLVVIVGIYLLTLLYSRTEIKRWAFFIKLQEGLAPLHNRKVFITGFCVSLFSWLLQLSMIHLTQLAFGIELPFWNALLVLVAVNLAVVVPSGPAHLGTFELACVLSYTFLGIDKNVGLLIGATYHLVQVLPVTVIGAVLLLVDQCRPWCVARASDPDEAYYQ